MTTNQINQLVGELETAEQNLEEAEARKVSATQQLEREVQQLIEEIDSYFNSGVYTEKGYVWVYMNIPPGRVYTRGMLDQDKGVWIKYDPHGLSSLLVRDSYSAGVVVYTNLKAHDEHENALIGDLHKVFWLRSVRQRWNYNTVKAWAEDVRQLHELVIGASAGS